MVFQDYLATFPKRLVFESFRYCVVDFACAEKSFILPRLNPRYTQRDSDRTKFVLNPPTLFLQLLHALNEFAGSSVHVVPFFVYYCTNCIGTSQGGLCLFFD